MQQERVHHIGRLDWLTGREVEVLQELVNGYGPVELADRLSISKHTARTHIKNILSKLGVHSCLEAASLAVEEGMRPHRPPHPTSSMTLADEIAS